MTTSLTNLADCKAWLGVTSSTDDALLTTLVGDVSRAILADLGRAAVLPTTYVDTLDGGGARALPLRQWPVTQVASCVVDGLPVAPSTSPGQPGYALDGADPSPPGSMQRLVYRNGVFPRGVGNVAVSYRAGYEIIGEQAVVPTAAPFIVTAAAPYGAWMVDTGVAGTSASYTVADGTYTFASAAAGATIALSYGYIPADLARAALEWIADRYVGRTRIGRSSKTLGGQETTSFVVKAMPDIVDRLLRPYRRIAG